MEGVTLTQKEQTRLQVLNSVLAYQVSVCQAAEVLGVSESHMRRILAAYRRKRAAALAHGNRGRQPANTTTETTTAAVMYLARTRYAGVNHTHMTELLVDGGGIVFSYDIGITRRCFPHWLPELRRESQRLFRTTIVSHCPHDLVHNP